MAGGSGTRLWPASTYSKPKQFLSLPKGSGQTDRSFFGTALNRALAVIGESGDGRVIIIAGRNHTKHIVDECAKLEAQKRKRLVLIPEPLPRNTGPAIACALLYVNWISAGRERNILVQTSDHIIQPLDVFKADVNTAAAMAQADKLVVFGIRPTKPETGYGYIETAGILTTPAGKNPKARYEPVVYSVASFREKPDLEKAKAFIAAKRFYWNSGMLTFSSRFLLEEFRRNAPEVMAPFKKLVAPSEKSYHTQKGLRILDESVNLEEAYQKVKAISFEHAITEKCRSVVMVNAGFSWIDVGSWDEYARLTKQTSSEVFSIGEPSSTCFVDSDIPVALCGVKDLIVVARAGSDGKPPVLLISKKGKTQYVKEIVDKIKAAGRTELL